MTMITKRQQIPRHLPMPLGYQTGADGTLELSPSAEVVRLAFLLYTTTARSFREIVGELRVQVRERPN